MTNNVNGLRALLEIEENYTIDKKKLAQEIYSTKEADHPGVANIYNLKDTLKERKRIQSLRKCSDKQTIFNWKWGPYEK